MNGVSAKLLAESRRISMRLTQPLTGAERLELKQAIVDLFHQTDANLQELAAFKESIRELIAAFKDLPPESPAERGASRTAAATPLRSVRHDHVGASTWIERGWSALAAGEWGEAERHLEHALALDGTSAAAQAFLSWALMAQGQVDEALRLCQEVLVRVPDHQLSRVMVGAICLRKGVLGEAIEHLSRVAGEAGDHRAVLYANYWLGVAYLDRDMAVAAEEALRSAVTRGPNLAEGWLELGFALWYQDRGAEARQAWLNGAAIRHSAAGRRCQGVLEVIAKGGRPERQLSP